MSPIEHMRRLKVNPDVFLFKILGAWDVSKFFNSSIFTIVPSDKVFVNNFNTFWSSFGPTRFFWINQIDEKVIVSFIEILTPSFTPILGLKSFGQPWSYSNSEARFLCTAIRIFEHDQIRWRTCASYCPFRHVNFDSSFLTDRSDELLLILLFFFVSLCVIFLNFSLIFRLNIDLCKFLWKNFMFSV